MGFYWLSWLANQKERKAIDNVASFWIKLDFSPHLFPAFNHFGVLGFWVLVILKNKLKSVFYAYVPLLMISFIITLSKFNAEPLAALSKFTAEALACLSWFHNHFDNVMTQFIINKRKDAWKTWKKSICLIEYKIPDLWYINFNFVLLFQDWYGHVTPWLSSLRTGCFLVLTLVLESQE